VKILKILIKISFLFGICVFSKTGIASQCIDLDELPVEITDPGCYILKSDISIRDAHTNSITIKSSNVEIDLNGYEIRNLSGPESSSNGIYANSVQDISIKNGSINGYFYAIKIDGGSNGILSKNILIKNITAKNNYFRGFMVEAENTLISGNKIINTGGTKVYPDAFAMAIEVKGNFCSVKDNFIDQVDATGVGEGIGISLSTSRKDCTINGNTIKSSLLKNATFGIWLSAGISNTVVSNNKISGFTYPFSIPRKIGEITTIFRKNEMRLTQCNPLNYSSYFHLLPESNKFFDNHLPCPILISEILKQKYDLDSDATANFRLASSMYQCIEEPHLSRTACCNMKKDSINYFEKAASLGSYEAKRVLPRVRNRVNKVVAENPMCN